MGREMKTIQETKEWLLANRVDEDGNLDLLELDFSDFDGNVYISDMRVKKDLFQSRQKVGGSLSQCRQKVGGSLSQCRQKVGENLYQDEQKVSGNLYQGHQEAKN